MFKRIRYFCLNDIILYFTSRIVYKRKGRKETIRFVYKSRMPWSLREAMNYIKKFERK